MLQIAGEAKVATTKPMSKLKFDDSTDCVTSPMIFYASRCDRTFLWGKLWTDLARRYVCSRSGGTVTFRRIALKMADDSVSTLVVLVGIEAKRRPREKN